MSDFPRMLYKAPGPHEIHGSNFDTLIAADEGEQEAALDGGWHLTTTEAKDAHERGLLAQSAAPAGNTDDPLPTRAELEQKATELGITFSPNISNKKLAERIEAALKD